MSISELKTSLLQARKHVEDLKQKQTELTSRLTDCRESLPMLRMKIAEARQERQRTSDKVILGEASTDDLEKCDKLFTESEERHSKSQELFDVLAREIKVLADGIPKAISEGEAIRRRLWEAIAEQLKSEIPTKIFDLVEKWLSVKTQLGQDYEFSLKSLFKRPLDGKVQEIQQNLRKQYGLD